MWLFFAGAKDIVFQTKPITLDRPEQQCQINLLLFLLVSYRKVVCVSYGLQKHVQSAEAYVEVRHYMPEHVKCDKNCSITAINWGGTAI